MTINKQLVKIANSFLSNFCTYKLLVREALINNYCLEMVKVINMRHD